jgi:hypothetical protein
VIIASINLKSTIRSFFMILFCLLVRDFTDTF